MTKPAFRWSIKWQNAKGYFTTAFTPGRGLASGPLLICGCHARWEERCSWHLVGKAKDAAEHPTGTKQTLEQELPPHVLVSGG